MTMVTQSAPATTGPSVKIAQPMTLTEKIIAKACDKSVVRPNDNVWVKTDVLMTHDVCGPGTIGNFYKEFGADAKVWDNEGVVIIPDHYIFTADPRANRNVDILREFAAQQNLKYFYDITDRGNFKVNPDYKGVCHVALAQEGHCRPGEVLFGTDSHTCNAGAFGQFATGIGNTDASFVMGTGKLLIKTPATMRFALNGEIPDYLLAKDVILQIIGDIGVAGATYRSMEFAGSALSQLSMEERQTLCNMAIEAGGKNGIIPADEITRAYVDQRNAGQKPYEVFAADAKATYFADKTYDMSQLEPVVAMPHSPDNKALAKDCRDTKIDRVYIGSCTGGKTEDFAAAARVLDGQKVRVPTFLVPATQKVYNDIQNLKINGRTMAQIFREAGCIEPASPSCAACLGGPADTFARMNEPLLCVSTTNRNFPGRMGHKDAGIFLASPYTAAASAVTGYVTDPREVYGFDKARRHPVETLLER
ncbi:homoaconitate hydratase family protein [Tribonema minus]|uniref:Homoaconitate hydratase family protein n=1 Tax=Tribonema minus TaxID=303371 RepID=A0A835YVF1_9STRA|nr:homoaconitate hydratase family protein [Tribonema minus]